MLDLVKQHCNELSSDEHALSDEAAEELSQQLEPAWQLDLEDRKISTHFNFKNYYQTIAFVNVIAQIAHQQNHHPDLTVSYNRCTVSYSTHSVGGLSINDFICAAKINAAQTL